LPAEAKIVSIDPKDVDVGPVAVNPSDVGTAPKTIGKPAAKPAINDDARQIWGPIYGRPFKNVVGDALRTGLHALPYVAALAGPEGIAASAAVQGVAGATEEIGTQTLDRISGKRKQYDWGAVGWNAGWNAAFGAVGSATGKLISEVSGAGTRALLRPEANRLIQGGATVTPQVMRSVAQKASDEMTSKTMLDTLGQHLGMTEEQSAKMVGAYDEGRQVGDAVFKTDRMVQGEFSKRYDDILGPHNATPIDGAPIRTSIEKSQEWMKSTGNAGHVRPSLVAKLEEIKAKASQQAGFTDVQQAMTYLVKNKVPLPSKITGDTDLIALANEKAGAGGANIAQVRGWRSELRAMDRTKNLTDVEQSVVSHTERALNGTIADVVKAKDPQAAAKLAEVDGDYGIFKSNFRTFWRALKDKKSLSEVGDAIYDQMGKRPDALRYMLSAADRAGRMDDMRLAFLNKMWRESQTAGGAVNRADALKTFAEKFAPGSGGKDILEMVLGKRPGVTDSVSQFSQRLADMSKAQEAVKDPALTSRLRRVMQYRMILGGIAGGGLSYTAFHKDPVQSVAIGLGIMAGIEGFSAVAKNPALNRAWVQWISTNPAAPEWIERGARLVGQASKAGLIGKPQDAADGTSSR
jgi:hypothetical protein